MSIVPGARASARLGAGDRSLRRAGAISIVGEDSSAAIATDAPLSGLRGHDLLAGVRNNARLVVICPTCQAAFECRQPPAPLHGVVFDIFASCVVKSAASGINAEAREAAARVLEVDSAFTISAWIARGGQSNAKLLIGGLRVAGLPEQGAVCLCVSRSHLCSRPFAGCNLVTEFWTILHAIDSLHNLHL